MLKRTAVLTGICILLPLILAACKPQNMVSDGALAGFGLSSSELAQFRLGHDSYDKAAHVRKIILQKLPYVLKIEATDSIDNLSANRLIEEEVLTMRALYGAALTPYPGEISRQVVCNEEFMPAYNTTKTQWLSYTHISLYATERFTYGACAKDLVKYMAVIAWAYCDDRKTLYKLELFSPLEDSHSYGSLLDMITSLRCQKQ